MADKERAPMLGWGKKGAEPTKQAAGSQPDAVSGFPRGLPDGDRHKPLATGRWPSPDELAASLEQWRPGLFLIGRDAQGRYYGHGDDRHIVTVAGSRSGKGVSLIVPNLLQWKGSCIAIDPKGELATVTASRRSDAGSEWSVPMGGKVYVLDPYRRVSGPAEQFQAAFNPLQDLNAHSESGLDLAWQIADALIIQSQGDGAHWTQSARSFLTGLILYVAAKEVESKHLIRVRALLTQSRAEFKAMLAEMKGLDGPIAHAAEALDNKPPAEKWSVVSTCETHTAFLEGEPMKRVLQGSDFKMEDLKAERVTVYLCLPATRLATHGRWLRLMISMALEAMERTGALPDGKPPVLFCLDEFAALGHMENIEAAAGQIASFGVKLYVVIQDLTQLQRDYKLAWETFLGNAGLLTFFGNTDLTTAEHIAKRLGDVEVIRTVHTTSSSEQTSSGNSAPTLFQSFAGSGTASMSSGRTVGATENENQQVMRGPLMNPNEIFSLFAREAGNVLAFIPHPTLPPFALYRCEYFSEEDEALFGGLYNPPPGKKPPSMRAADRRERDRQAGH